MPPAYLQYTSIFDLVLDPPGLWERSCFHSKACGVKSKRPIRATVARDQLELMARMDPSPGFESPRVSPLLARGEDGVEADADGCVAVLDIDNLKQINDRLGHTVGQSNSLIASAMRSLIRADDMLLSLGRRRVSGADVPARRGGSPPPHANSQRDPGQDRRVRRVQRCPSRLRCRWA